jgi:PKD repeat protein
MWDGTSWSALGSGIGGDFPYVNALAVDNEEYLYVGGEFTTVGGVSANNIAKWDGSSWSALGSGMDYEVRALAVDGDGNLYAGGDFTTAGGVSANYIAKWDGSNWSALGSGMSEYSWVSALAVDSAGNLYASGHFTASGGVIAYHLAMWDGTSWSALGSGNGMSDLVYSLAIDSDGNLYAGGPFTTAGGASANNIARWNGTSWSALGSGMGGNGIYVRALAVDSDGNLYAGGDFTIADGVSANYIAMWDGLNWSPLGSGMNNSINALAVDGLGNLYAGGAFTTAGGVKANRIALWDGSSWSALGSGLDYRVDALAVDGDDNLYAGGMFTTAGEVSANNIAKWDGSNWSALGSGMNSSVDSLVFDGDGNLYAGGSFTTAGGVSVNRIAKWDGSSWSAMGSGISERDRVYALAIDSDGNLYAGGEFTAVGDVSANYIARWDGSSWSGLGSGIGDVDGGSATVFALEFNDDGNLFSGGDFTTAGEKSSAHIALWYPSPTAVFSGSPLSGIAPLTVNFTNLSSSKFDTCSWDFGDGGCSSSCDNPSNEYTTAGVYTVSLEVSGPGGNTTDTKTDYITVYEPAAADFNGSPRNGMAPLTVDFTNKSSGDYSSCDWDFGDGGTGINCLDPSHTYDQAGTYTVALIVSGLGGTDTLTRSNYITIYEPVNADFGASPTSGVAPLAVDFSNKSSGDFDTCVWDFGDGGTSNSCLDPSYTYIQTGTFTVTLTVSGFGGSDTLTNPDFIRVDEPGTPPVADFSATPTSGKVPLNVNFSNLSSGDFDICAWDFGDGGASDEYFGISHTYTIPGTYTVTLTVEGLAGTDTKSVPNYITVEPYQLFLPVILKPQ